MIFERYPISSKNSSHFAISSSCGNSTSTPRPRLGGGAVSGALISFRVSLPLWSPLRVILGAAVSTGVRTLRTGVSSARASTDAAVGVFERRSAFRTFDLELGRARPDRIRRLGSREAQTPHPSESYGIGPLKGVQGEVCESARLREGSFRPTRWSGGMDLPEELAARQRFHGHLGVYVTLGLRMGAVGKRRFGHYKGLTASVRSQPDPPMRCVLDGIQFSSGCTFGKGNISLEPGSEPEVTFGKEGKRLRVALKKGWREKIDREMSKDKELEQSLFYYEIPESDVFDIRDG